MLPQHKEIFYTAAQHLNCWIGLREPNELADKWIGLVVNPLLCPGAFKQNTLQDAIEKWEQFSGGGSQLPPGFTFEKEGREKGLLKYHGCGIHADYDLMAVCNAGEDGEIGNTSNEQENELFAQVERFLNMRFNTKMIQHGSEFMYKDGVGARETEQVYFFGPNRRFKLSYSSMPKKAMAH